MPEFTAFQEPLHPAGDALDEAPIDKPAVCFEEQQPFLNADESEGGTCVERGKVTSAEAGGNNFAMVQALNVNQGKLRLGRAKIQEDVPHEEIWRGETRVVHAAHESRQSQESAPPLFAVI